MEPGQRGRSEQGWKECCPQAEERRRREQSAFWLQSAASVHLCCPLGSCWGPRALQLFWPLPRLTLVAGTVSLHWQVLPSSPKWAHSSS